MLDAGFVRKRLRAQNKRRPRVEDITACCDGILAKEPLRDHSLLRIYYYDAPPLDGTSANPLSGEVFDFGRSDMHTYNKALLDRLVYEPNFAVRRGSLLQTGWKVGKSALKELSSTSRPVRAEDLVPDITQKGVDMRIGLDIAFIALKRIADILVLVTGDSDFVTPMKFARKEGMRVYLDVLGHVSVRSELKAHADLVL